MSRNTESTGWRKDEPPDKRRRTDGTVPPEDANLWGGDDWDETDYADIDVLCSQPINDESSKNDFLKPRIVAPVSKNKVSACPSGSFTSSFDSKSATGTFSQGSSISAHNPRVQTNLSYPLHSGAKPKSTYPPLLVAPKPKTYPLQKSTIQTDVNQNLAPRNTGPSPNFQKLGRQTNAPGLGSNGSSSSIQLSQPQDNFVDSIKKELEKVREENDQMKKLMQSAKEEQYGKDGQIRILRESLSKKEAELFKQRQERSKDIDEKVHDYVEREKAHIKKENVLVEKIEKLKAALQFKDHEISEVQSNLKRLEQRTQSPHTAMSPSHQSPRAGKRPMTELKKSPVTPKSVKMAFPNRRTFMASESVGERSTPSPILNVKREGEKPTPPPVLNMKKEIFGGSPLAMSSAKSAADIKQEADVKGRLRKYALKVASCKGAVSGRHLMARLVDHHDSTDEKEGDLVKLLNNAGSPPKAKEAVTPGSKPRLKSQSSLEAEQEEYRFGARCCRQARSGLTKLLSHSCNQSINSKILSSKTSGACDLLPIIETSLKHYLDYQSELDSNKKSGSGSNSNKSLSYDSSLESVSSSMRSLEISRHLSVKSVADTALKILCKLVCYSEEVRDFLLATDREMISGIDPLGSRGDEPTAKIAEPKPGTSHDRAGGGDAESVFQPSGILHMLFKLVAPSISDDKPTTSDTTELTLKILTMLARLGSIKQMEQFLPLVAKTTLSKCLSLTSEANLIMRTVELLQALSISKKVVSSFCTQTADCCLFLDVYSVCLVRHNGWTTQEHTAICDKVVNFLWTVVSHHKGGVTLLLESDCSCSVEVVKSLVVVLNDEMVLYKNGHCECEQSYNVLARGIKLLQIFSLRDQLFVDHWADVELQYISLVSSMQLLLKQMNSPDESMTMAIQDLWEVDELFLQGLEADHEEEESPMEKS
ncbi:uncharacterized protein LOC135490942 [Lineus longissimus]|uniref:uncharacterized protein LOC135490942 n=1 Tax=Lineus longissimus TaxID=88925 RepID=UPI002B4D90D4